MDFYNLKLNLVRASWLVATVLALLMSVTILFNKHFQDNHFKEVLLVTDYDDLLLLCNYSGMTMPELLTDLKKTGYVGAVAVNMCTFESALAKGYIKEKLDFDISSIKHQNNDELEVNQGYPFTAYEIVSYQLSQGIEPLFNLLYGSGLNANSPIFIPSTQDSNGLILMPVDINRKTLKFPIGFNLQELEEVKQAGLIVIPRLINSPAFDRNDIANYFDTLTIYANFFMSTGDSVFGYPNLIRDIAKYFRQNNLNFGIVEFDPQLGSDRLAAYLKDKSFIVHSISQAEMAKNSPESCIARYVRAVRERSIRICYIRPFLLDYPNIKLANTTIADTEGLWVFNRDYYFKKLTNDLQKYGFSVIDRLPDYSAFGYYFLSGNALQYFIALFSLGFILYTATLIIKIPEDYEVWLSIGSIVFVVLGVIIKPLLTLHLIALLVAICSPVLAVLLGYKWLQRQPKPTSVLSVILSYLIIVILNTFLSSLIYGLLTAPGSVNKQVVFTGVQLAIALPILLIVFWSWDNLHLNTTQTIWERLQSFVKAKVTFGDAIAAVVALIIIAVKILRSGNETPLAPSELELSFRGYLEQLMFARPRTTELIGLPLLMCGMYLINYRNLFASICIVIGMMGLTSQVNSFCHLHTPIGLTVVREFLGIVTGLVFGVILLLLLRNFRWRPTLRR